MEEIKRVLLARRRVLLFLVLFLFSLFRFTQYGYTERYQDMVARMDGFLQEYQGVDLDEIAADLYERTEGDSNFTLLGSGGYKFYDQVNYIRGFPAYLEGVQKRAQQMGTVSIFANADPGIKKTAEDFKRLEGIRLTLGHDDPVTHTMGFELSDWLLAGYMLVLVLSFVSERKRGLWNVVCASRRGRVTLAGQRVLALALGATVAGLLFTGAEVFLAYDMYGGFDEMGRMIQSVSIFQSLTIPMTAGQFWIFFALLRILGAFVFGLIVWLFFHLISDRRMAIISFAVFAGSQWLLYSMMAPSKLLRAVNLFTFVFPRNLVLSYNNIEEFGSKVGQMATSLGAAALILVLGLTTIFLSARYMKPTGGYGWISKLIDRWRQLTAPLGYHASQFFHELHKVLVVGRGILVLILAIYLAFTVAESPYLRDTRVTEELEAYFRRSQGPVVDGTDDYRVDYIAREEEKLANQLAEREALYAAYEAGEISAEEYSNLMWSYSNLDAKLQGFEEYKLEIETLKTMDGAYVMPHWVYSQLFGVSGDTVSSLQFICILAVLLLGILYALAEAQTGMTKSRRATRLGRGKALLARYGAGCVLTAIITLSAFGLQFVLLRKAYGSLPWLEAPVNSLIYFRDVSGSVSVLTYWLIQVGLRTAAMCGWSCVVLWLGDRLQK